MKPQKGILTSNDFKSNSGQVYINTNITKRNPGMILIYASWCGHCHRFMPIFNDLQQQLGSDFPLLALEDAELNKNQQLSRDLNVNGYPTIKFFDQSGKIISDYNKKRDKASLLDHICKIYHHCITYH